MRTGWREAQRSQFTAPWRPAAQQIKGWLRDGEKGKTRQIFKGRKDQIWCLFVGGKGEGSPTDSREALLISREEGSRLAASSDTSPLGHK